MITGAGVASNQTVDRRDIDDGATAGLAHDRDGQFCAQEYSLGVDRHDSVPKFLRSFFDDEPAADAGIVYQNVQLSVSADCGINCSTPILFAGDVHWNEQRLATGIGDL